MMLMVLKHERNEEKEDRSGRVRSRNVTTWDVVDAMSVLAEFSTKRAALEDLWKREAK